MDGTFEIKDNHEDRLWNSCTFVAATWEIWKARNAAVFRSSIPDPTSLCFKIKSLAHVFYAVFNKTRAKTLVGNWVPPQKGWIKLNTDGGVNFQTATGVVGGLCRDDKGLFLWGFSRQIPVCEVLTAEAKALHVGLSLAWERRTHKLMIEVDSTVLLHLIRGESVTNDTGLQNIIKECKALLCNPWDVQIGLINRDCNRSADALAKLSYGDDVNDEFWASPPAAIHCWLIEDNL
ncbi:hypothetical protein OROGR_027154 [Orobanche gracilis]